MATVSGFQTPNRMSSNRTSSNRTPSTNLAVVPVKEPFPYKREFIDPEELWQNAVSLDLATLRVIRPTERWGSLPRNIRWEFQGKNVAIVVSKDAYDKVNKLVDYFSEEARLQARRSNCPSPLEFYERNYDMVAAKAQELLISDPSKSFRFHLREANYLLANECSTFKITASKALFKYLKSRVVLDPSAGWGDRILGAAAAGVQVYHGVDPNPLLQPAYNNIISFLNNHGISQDNYKLLIEDFLQSRIDESSYDTVFTSPPFYNYEVYVDDPKQSIEGRTSVDDWLNDFLYPYIRKAWAALIPGGYMALYISDVRTGRYTNAMFHFVSRELHGRFLGIIAVTDEMLDYGFPIWVWRK